MVAVQVSPWGGFLFYLFILFFSGRFWTELHPKMWTFFKVTNQHVALSENPFWMCGIASLER